MNIGPIDPHLHHLLVPDPRTRGDGDAPDCFLCGKPIHYHVARGLKVGPVNRQEEGKEPEWAAVPLWCHATCVDLLPGTMAEQAMHLEVRYHRALQAVMRGGEER